MKRQVKKAIILVDHIQDCYAKGTKHEWSGIIDGHYWGNYNGTPNTKIGSYYIWHRVCCNDTRCGAIKAVNSIVLNEASI